jgi:hypothetical protein
MDKVEKSILDRITSTDKATLTSYIGLLLMPILSYFALSQETSSFIIGLVAAVLGFIFQYYNEKYNSTVISGKDDDESLTVDDDTAE